MIQISTPIDACSSLENRFALEGGAAPENTNASAAWSQKAKTKNKPGIFAKLLEGLTAKVNSAANAKVGISGAMRQENPGISNPFTEKTGKNVIKSASGAKKSLGTGSSDENDPLSEVFAFSWQDLSMGELGYNTQNGSEFSGFVKKDGKSGFFGKDFFHNGSNSTGLSAINEETASGLGRNSGSNEILDTAFRNVANRTGKGNSLSAENYGGNKAKNDGAGNLLSVSFRDLEAEYQSLSQQAFANIAGSAGADKDNSRLSELRGRRSRERPTIEVRDLRTGAGEAGSEKGIAGAVKETGVLRPLSAEMELPVNLNLSEGGEKAVAGKAGREIFQTQSFEDALAAELRGNLSADIVRDATVIVRNGGEGSIRLSLRPASLGDVKIRLEMTENKITGHIIVESNDAFRAFERELPVLEKAFRDSGFSETSLDMSFARDQGNFSAGEQNQHADYESLSPLAAASRYEAGTDLTEVNQPEDLILQGGLVLSNGGTGLPPGRTPVNLLV